MLLSAGTDTPDLWWQEIQWRTGLQWYALAAAFLLLIASPT